MVLSMSTLKVVNLFDLSINLKVDMPLLVTSKH